MIKFAISLVFLSLSAKVLSESLNGFQINRLVDEMPIMTFRTLSQASMLIGSVSLDEDNSTRPLSDSEIVAKALYSYCDISNFSESSPDKRVNFEELLEERFLKPCSTIKTLPSRSTVSYTSRIAVLSRLHQLCNNLDNTIEHNEIYEKFMHLVEES